MVDVAASLPRKASSRRVTIIRMNFKRTRPAEPNPSNCGVTLAHIYSANGEMLMGTLRWGKDNAEPLANEVAPVSAELNRVRRDEEEAVLTVRAKAVETELIAKLGEKWLLDRTTKSPLGSAVGRMDAITTVAQRGCVYLLSKRRRVSRPTFYKFRLYIACDRENSGRALANYKTIYRTRVPQGHETEIVGVLQEPKRALGMTFL